MRHRFSSKELGEVMAGNVVDISERVEESGDVSGFSGAVDRDGGFLILLELGGDQARMIRFSRKSFAKIKQMMSVIESDALRAGKL